MVLYLDSNLSLSQGFRLMFYALTPNETMFKEIEEVPDYVDQATPYFVGLMIIELVVTWLKEGQGAYRVNDALTSISAGVLSRLPYLLGQSFELAAYIYIWENCRLFFLPWDSVWTWCLAFLGVDVAYYWLHRLSHEVNIFWSGHQVHHSSEDYNLTTALRQSVLQKYFTWFFNLPMAFFIPPSVFIVHLQFNLLYQFWIHTEIIGNLGPLELILNTPSHHRVHHGRNQYCIDKNYAGTLIIWDRIFGTFEPESEKVIYGLTHPINAFEPFWVQLHHLLYIWKTFWATPGISNKLSVVFKGPGWEPGKPRLGCPDDLPKVCNARLCLYKFTDKTMLWITQLRPPLFVDKPNISELWNSLHQSLYLVIFFPSFRSQMKTFLFDRAYGHLPHPPPPAPAQHQTPSMLSAPRLCTT
uniref:Transmembrane protein 195 n=1 Tax=Callorhinchus milii TaxID=7868 RepID=A0A4W3HZD2_CALMI